MLNFVERVSNPWNQRNNGIKNSTGKGDEVMMKRLFFRKRLIKWLRGYLEDMTKYRDETLKKGTEAYRIVDAQCATIYGILEHVLTEKWED
jgi:hypothetical protein